MDQPISEAFQRFIESVEAALGHPLSQRSLETNRYTFYCGAEACLGETLGVPEMGEDQGIEHMNAIASDIMDFLGVNSRN